MNLSDARVLVVDDEPALCEIFAQWMMMAGCGDVRTARDGQKALEMVKARPIDLLVTDVRMPLMDGVTLVRRLVELGFKIPSIIFVSAFGDVDQREMYGLGVEAFLSKPLRREDLMRALATAVAERSKLWRERPEIAPRQVLETTLPRAAISLGRSGFSTDCPVPLTQGRVSFHCEIAGEGKALAGQGYVRWYARIAQRTGIEIVYLDEACRDWVLKAIEDESPLAFVPSE